MASVNVLFFAKFREQVGFAEKSYPLTTDIGSLIEQIIITDPQAETVLKGNGFLTALNQDKATLESKLEAGDEVAFFPPVTGG